MAGTILGGWGEKDDINPKYCFEHLPEAYNQLRQSGRTGTEAFIMADDYENLLLYEEWKQSQMGDLNSLNFNNIL